MILYYPTHKNRLEGHREAQKGRDAMTPAYQLNALFQIVRTMQRTPEGREALEDKKQELRERALARAGKRKENK